MASILRQIVAGPRARHPEAGLDLCYVTDNIIVTSGPSSVWPKKAYRNPTDQLVKFLDYKHAGDWSIFEFRAEGTGYPDSEVYNRIHHFPWPDHHPPPFAIIPNLMAGMRNWIQRLDHNGQAPAEQKDRRVAVVHCKAGKGRSGTVACSYLISEEGWKREDALQRFTLRRMRSGFGEGVSIPSQLRWVRYVDRWTNELDKRYVERPVEILEVHVEGLRDGVKVAIEGYTDAGLRIKNFHIFNFQEKTVIEDGGKASSKGDSRSDLKKEPLTSPVEGTPQSSTSALLGATAAHTQTVILRPSTPVVLPSSDVNIDFERRNQAAYTGFTMVTSIAHVWFNAFFEGGCNGDDSGVFEIEWDAMDGIKGSVRKGTKALDRLKVIWQYAKHHGEPLAKVITQPEVGEKICEGEAANWKGEDTNPEEEAGAKHSDGVSSGRPGGALITMGAMINQGSESIGKELGLRKQNPESAAISRAASVERGDGEITDQPSKTNVGTKGEADEEEDQGVKAHGPAGEEYVSYGGDGAADQNPSNDQGLEGRKDNWVGHSMERSMQKVAGAVQKMKGRD